MLAAPTHDDDALFGVEHLAFARRQIMAGQDSFRGAVRNAVKDRPAAGQYHSGRTRQMKNVVEIEKQIEHVRAADDPHASIWHSKKRQRFLE